MKTRMYVLLFAATMAAGCMSNDTIDDADVNEAKLFGHYCGTYDANTHELKFFAQLRAGGRSGTTVRMNQGHLSIDGTEMHEHYGDEAYFNLFGTYYSLSQSTNQIRPNYVAAWDRSNGERFSNEIVMPEPFVIESPGAEEIVPVDTLLVSFTGQALRANESVTAILRGQSGTRARQERVSKKVTAGQRIVFSRDEVSQFARGATLSITLQKDVKVRPQVGHAAHGGLIHGRHIAPRVAFHLEE
jgi:hypothetical protein